jgi:hypothetical protein
VLVGLYLIITRLSGVTSLEPWGVAAVFAAVVSGITGVSVFALGTTFNYLVSLFYNRPIRQGLFGRPLLNPSLDHHFGWGGSVVFIIGFIMAVVTIALGFNGWAIERLWLYFLGSALFILVGVQLVIYWVLMRVLEELHQRDELTKKDLGIA